MLEVKFYEKVDDELLKFAVIISKHEEKWVFCKHKERNTYEIPGGHRENEESIMDTAKRELKVTKRRVKPSGTNCPQTTPARMAITTFPNKLTLIFCMVLFDFIAQYRHKDTHQWAD